MAKILNAHIPTPFLMIGVIVFLAAMLAFGLPTGLGLVVGAAIVVATLGYGAMRTETEKEEHEDQVKRRP